MISKNCVFVFDSPQTARLAQTKINSNFAHVAAIEGSYLTLTAGISELNESKIIALAFGGIEYDLTETKPTSEKKKSRWNSPKVGQRL